MYMEVTAQWLFYNYTMIENYTFLRNESQHLKFLYFRQVVVSAKCLFGEKSARHTVRSTKCSFDKVYVGKMSVRQNVRVPNQKSRKTLFLRLQTSGCVIIFRQICFETQGE